MSEVRSVDQRNDGQVYDDRIPVDNDREPAYEDRGPVDTSGYEERRVVRRPAWSPTQFVVLAVGMVLIVFGGVALARAGLHFTNVPSTRTKVAGLGFTSMSALITIVAGVIIACGSAHPWAARTMGWMSGVVLFAFGLVVALAPTSFTNMWGFTTANGVVLAIMGGILMLAAAIFPILGRSSTSYARGADTQPVAR
jgi:hypothetical protein